MSISIKGMEMPKTGEYRCVIRKWQQGGTITIDLYGEEELCGTIVPVPPHGRLGDLDRLEQMFADIDNAPYSGFDGEEPFYSAEDAARIIRLTPTIIEAEEGDEETEQGEC